MFYHLNCPVIDDLPTRVEKLLNIATDQCDADPDMVMPQHSFFKNDGWNHLMHCDGEFANDRIFINGEFPSVELFREFMDWLLPYLVNGSTHGFVGYYIPDGEKYPTLIISDESSIGYMDISVFGQKEYKILFDPMKRSLMRIPTKESLMDTIRSIFMSEEEKN